MEKMKEVLLLTLLLIFHTINVYAVNVGSYIVNIDISKYSKSYDGSCVEGPGVLVGIDHFDSDHTDYECSIRYYKKAIRLGVEVQVSQHAGGDSDRWLLHELDMEFRNYYGVPGKSYSPEQLDGQTILEDAVGGYNYRWLCGNKMIEIKYYDSQMTKPEPLEVVRAYLTKHPSTIQPFTLQQLRSEVSKIKWIKDEMERRLWLCDKWNAQFHAGKVTQNDLLQALVKSMTVFLNYRQKYFNVSATEDIRAIEGYWEKNDAASIQAKLSSYKSWWLANRAAEINL